MHVVDGRSTLVENAIKDEADYLWFLDDDMVPPVNTLERLMAQMDANPEYDYIGALCYKKTPPYGPCAFTAPAMTAARISAGSSERGLSSVTTTTSA